MQELDEEDNAVSMREEIVRCESGEYLLEEGRGCRGRRHCRRD